VCETCVWRETRKESVAGGEKGKMREGMGDAAGKGEVSRKEGMGGKEGGRSCIHAEESSSLALAWVVNVGKCRGVGGALEEAGSWGGSRGSFVLTSKQKAGQSSLFLRTSSKMGWEEGRVSGPMKGGH